MDAPADHAQREDRRGSSTPEPLLYTELASWWPILSEPADYAEEAEWYRSAILAHSPQPPRTLLELGSGGGSNASHLKAHFRMTLVDAAPGMLEVSRTLNPECEHVQGDMRSVRLGGLFDAVFVHDAISYMTTEADLRLAIRTAHVHCMPGGVALFCPDAIRETFRPMTSCGGHDREGKGLRYVEWSWDPDPDDSVYVADFAYLLRDETGSVRAVHDRHLLGLHPRALWHGLLADAGFRSLELSFEHSEVAPGSCVVFLGIKTEERTTEGQ